MNVLFLILSAFFMDDKKVIAENFKKYETAIVNMDTEAIVNLYAKDGQFGTITGSEEIRKYLNSFKHIKVQKYTTTTTNIDVKGVIANHEGTFIQIGLVNGVKKASHGLFRIIWTKENEEWKIKYMGIEKGKTIDQKSK
jgi:ketosteroid isomerase-like protein